jgi:hypothetical protein
MAALPSEILLYQSEDGETRIDVRLVDETVWLNQAQMAALFQRDRSVVAKHIKNIFDEGELDEDSVCAFFAQTADDGKTYQVAHYNLDVIISVGYRVKSLRGTQFRRWATQRLKEYIIKGFVMDDERLSQARDDYFDELVQRVRAIRTSERRFYQKITDIYATSMDYDASQTVTQEFFATVQNKFHFAIHGKTAAEVIKARADASEPLMGLTSFKGARVQASDVTIAKNYLTEDEIASLNRIVDQYLSFAEEQAARRIPMMMKDWITKLHGFLTLNDREILQGAGKVSKKDADRIAHTEFEKYRVQQDKALISDFDRSTKTLLATKPKSEISVLTGKKPTRTPKKPKGGKE